MVIKTPDIWKDWLSGYPNLLVDNISNRELEGVANQLKIVKRLADSSENIIGNLSFRYSKWLSIVSGSSNNVLLREHHEGVALHFLWANIQAGIAKSILARAYRNRVNTMLTEISALSLCDDCSLIPHNEDVPDRLPGYVYTNHGKAVFWVYPNQIKVRFQPFEMYYEY